MTEEFSGGEPIRSWIELREFALDLGLPKVEDAVSWGNPNLKAHGKMWCWWSPYIDAAVFKGTIEEREALMQFDPTAFVMHPHYKNHGLVLVAGGHIDRGWAEARLRHSWEAAAPKRWLKQWKAGEV